jgi:hypothetical protein
VPVWIAGGQPGVRAVDAEVVDALAEGVTAALVSAVLFGATFVGISTLALATESSCGSPAWLPPGADAGRCGGSDRRRGRRRAADRIPEQYGGGAAGGSGRTARFGGDRHEFGYVIR